MHVFTGGAFPDLPYHSLHPLFTAFHTLHLSSPRSLATEHPHQTANISSASLGVYSYIKPTILAYITLLHLVARSYASQFKYPTRLCISPPPTLTSSLSPGIHSIQLVTRLTIAEQLASLPAR